MVLALLFTAAPQAVAAPIVYTFKGTGTGNVDSTRFSDVAFKIDLFGDTNGVSFGRTDPYSSYVYRNTGPATIFISGIGSGEFLPAPDAYYGIEIFNNPEVSVLGISYLIVPDYPPDLLDIQNPALATYDLKSSIGPIFDPDPSAINQFNNVDLTIGSLSFESARDVTFTATVVPEPSTLLISLLGFSLVGQEVWRRGQRNVKATRKQ